MSTYIEIPGQPRCAIIGAHNAQEFMSPMVDGEIKSRGLIPRDYATHPVGYYSWATAVDFPLIPASERAARIAQKDAEKSHLTDIRMVGGENGAMIPSRDQNSKGYCWAHSGTSAHLLLRAAQGQPYSDLSAYSIACQEKSFRDEGGWGAEGIDFQVKFGCATSKTWPQQSMSRSNVNEAMKADALAHRVIDQWADLNVGEYDRNLTWDQVATLLLSNVPVVVDYNWWSHSVCAAKLVANAVMRIYTRMGSGKLATLQEFMKVWDEDDPVTAGTSLMIWNSWGDSWSSQGMGILTGGHAVPDGAIAPRTVSLTP